jgi:hypothetical protein
MIRGGEKQKQMTNHPNRSLTDTQQELHPRMVTFGVVFLFTYGETALIYDSSEEDLMQPISRNAHRKLQQLVKEQAAALAIARRDGLAKIAARRNRIVREEAIGSYCEARFWQKTYTARLAAVHPETAPAWSPNARARLTGL